MGAGTKAACIVCHPEAGTNGTDSLSTQFVSQLCQKWILSMLAVFRIFNTPFHFFVHCNECTVAAFCGRGFFQLSMTLICLMRNMQQNNFYFFVRHNCNADFSVFFLYIFSACMLTVWTSPKNMLSFVIIWTLLVPRKKKLVDIKSRKTMQTGLL